MAGQQDVTQNACFSRECCNIATRGFDARNGVRRGSWNGDDAGIVLLGQKPHVDRGPVV